MAARALIGFVILHSVTGTHGVLDFTCFSSNPRIDRNGDNHMFIGGYRSGDDTGASVSFQRAIDTGTGSGLPSGSSERDHDATSARILDMPQSGGKQRIGAFNCVAEKDGVTERIATTVMASDSEIIPQQVSQTVSVGESVRFVMERSTSQHSWRQNGNSEISSWRGLTQVTIDSVSVDDAGVYECHRLHVRNQGIHAIFQLLVRTCEDGKWGANCQSECPKCLNGGICDDRSGECVCAPGFSGTSCQTVHGRNRFGQDGQLRCSGSDPHGYGCQGKLLCLPHPYGCSCAAGFKGIDCNEECEDGYYGANCRQECHCASRVPCLKDTGECDGGQCHPNWYGVNCQERCLEPVPQIVTGLLATPESKNLRVEWDANPNPCSADIEYVVTYELTNLEQCQEQENANIQEAGAVRETQIIIPNLFYYSDYIIYVKARHNGILESGTTSISQTTEQTEPSSPPTNVTTINVTSSAITFKWTEPSCGKRHGQIVSYMYYFTNTNNTENVSDSTPHTSITISNLTPFTQYSFQVAAVTEAGIGPRADNLLKFTSEAVPSAPASIEVSDVTKTSMKMTWQGPLYPNGIIANYSIENKVIEKPYDPMFNMDSESKEVILGVNRRSYTFYNLKPSTKYEVKVFAYSGAGRGDAAMVEHFTHPATGQDLSTPGKLQAVDNSQISSSTVVITIPRSRSVFLTGYQVAVELINPKREAPLFGKYSESPYSYVAAEVAKDYGPEFVIGDNKTYGMYYNPPLKDGQSYRLYTAFVSRINQTIYGVSWSEGTDVTTLSYSPECQLQSNNSELLTWTIGFLVCIIAVLVTVVVIICFKLRNMYKRLDKQELQSSPMDNTYAKSYPSNKQIELSVDGYAEYKPEGNESKYLDLGTDGTDKQAAARARGESLVPYEEIPSSIFGKTPDKRTTDEISYVNASVELDVRALSTKRESETLYEDL